jgi:hypothetical protein
MRTLLEFNLNYEIRSNLKVWFRALELNLDSRDVST